MFIKSKADTTLLSLLVSLYNQPIQFYDHFPEVIICGKQRLNKEDFDLLKNQDLIIVYYTDSFGKFYKLSVKAHELLSQQLLVKKRKRIFRPTQMVQATIPFL